MAVFRNRAFFRSLLEAGDTEHWNANPEHA